HLAVGRTYHRRQSSSRLARPLNVAEHESPLHAAQAMIKLSVFQSAEWETGTLPQFDVDAG
ncbi:MAG: hypothetical protein OXR03_14635, partial [Rhodospirillaceae bacterium]|nr:hypothetical protein [Rhodospirillaceae bacterium]